MTASNASSVAAVPEGMDMLMPHLVCAGAADAIDFYARAFGAVEQMRLPDAGGKLIHACVSIGSSMVLLVDENPQWGALGPLALKGTPVTLHRYVDDVDAAVARAVDAGATLTMPPADMFWGDRYAVVQDPWGHSWSLATHQKDLNPEQIQAAFAQACA